MSKATQKRNSIPDDKFALYEKLVAADPRIELKGAANPYTSLNGHMFSCQNLQGIVAIRLPEKEREAFLKKYKTRLSVAYGIVRKEYVEVPEGLLKKTSELKPYLSLSYDYVKSLKPVPSKKK